MGAVTALKSGMDGSIRETIHRMMIQNGTGERGRMKNKRWIAGLIALLLVGSLAGMPSGAGTWETFIRTAEIAHAATQPNEQLLEYMRAFRNAALPEHITAMANARTKADALIGQSATKKGLTATIWNRIVAKLTSTSDYPDVTEENVFKLFVDLATIQFDPDDSHLNDFIQNETHRKLMNQLVKLSKNDPTLGSDLIEFADAIEFIQTFESQAASRLVTLTPDQMLVLFLDSGARRAWMRAELEAVINNGSKMSDVLKGLGIQADDLLQFYDKLAKEIDAHANFTQSARFAAVFTYARMKVVFSKEVTANGTRLTPKLSILDKEVDKTFLRWTVSGSNTVTVEDSTDTLVLQGNGPATVTVTGHFGVPGLFEKPLYTGQVTMSATGTGGSGVIIIPQDPVQETEDGIRLGDSAATVTRSEQSVKYQFDSSALADAFALAKENKKPVVLEVPVDAAQIDVSMDLAVLRDAAADEPEAVLVFRFGDTLEYELPLQAADFAQLAEQLGGDVAITLQVEFVEPPESVPPTMELVSELVKFSFIAEGNGQRVEITSFGNVYVTRVIRFSGEYPLQQLTAFYLEEEGSEPQFVPSVIEESDGQYRAVIMRPGNSIYGVAVNEADFSDLSGHWSERDVERMASKFLVKGVGQDRFAPDRPITRAEFAALLIRALGNPEPSGQTVSFIDLKDNAWYAQTVRVAAAIGLVQGFTDGTFRPNDSITREQMAVMIARARVFAGKQNAVLSNPQSVLSRFHDAAKVQPWAVEALADAVNSGIIQGTSADSLSPDRQATRAQAVVMLKRLLEQIGFM